VRIESAYNLYNYYINIHKIRGDLPTKKELLEMTTLSDWKLRDFNNQLKSEGKLITDKNKLIVVTDVDELANKRKRHE